MKTKSQLASTLSKIPVFPIMGEWLNEQNTLVMDFSAGNQELEKIDLSNTGSFDNYVSNKISIHGKQFGIGGYLEHRAIYRRSINFITEKMDFRNIHLGVDIWGPSFTAVYAPLEGKVHSFQNNEGFGDYGPTIILKHKVEGETFFSLYGHLSLDDLATLEPGQIIAQGQKFCHFGPFPENGDWPPHLHFQLVTDLKGMIGDFPGVCAKRDQDLYEAICPDPNLLIRFR